MVDNDSSVSAVLVCDLGGFRLSYQAHEPCVMCGTTMTQRCYHHVLSRKSGGPDLPWNLMPLCLADHNLIHAKGLTTTAKNHADVKLWLLNNGWEFICGKWRRFN